MSRSSGRQPIAPGLSSEAGRRVTAGQARHIHPGDIVRVK